MKWQKVLSPIGNTVAGILLLVVLVTLCTKWDPFIKRDAPSIFGAVTLFTGKTLAWEYGVYGKPSAIDGVPCVIVPSGFISDPQFNVIPLSEIEEKWVERYGGVVVFHKLGDNDLAFSVSLYGNSVLRLEPVGYLVVVTAILFLIILVLGRVYGWGIRHGIVLAVLMVIGLGALILVRVLWGGSIGGEGYMGFQVCMAAQILAFLGSVFGFVEMKVG